MEFRLLLSSRVRTSGDGSSPVTQQRHSAMSAWRSGAENRPAWLQSRSTSVSGAFFCVCTMRFPQLKGADSAPASLSLLGRMCGGAGVGLPLLLFARRGSAEFDLCLQFRNLFAKRCQLVLYSSGSWIPIWPAGRSRRGRKGSGKRHPRREKIGGR